MYCMKCGTLNEAEASFCKNCGAKLDIEGDAPQQDQTQTTGESAAPIPDKKQIIASKLHSPAILIAAIAKTVSFGFIAIVFLIALIFTVSGNYFLTSIMPQYDGGAYIEPDHRYDGFNGFDDFDDFDEYYDDENFDPENFLNGSAYDTEGNITPEAKEILKQFTALMVPCLALIVCAAVGNILMLVGLWMLYAAPKKDGSVSTSGFTAVKASAVAKLISIGLGIFTFGMIPFVVAKIGTVDGAAFAGSALISAIVVIIACGFSVFAVIFNIKLIKLMNSLKDSVVNDAPLKKPSMYLIVMLCIMMATTLLEVGYLTLTVIVPAAYFGALFYALLMYRNQVKSLSQQAQ